MQKVKVRDFGTDVQGIELKADPKHPEPEYFRVKIPGGDIDIVRTSDNSFWVHVRVNRPENSIDTEAPNGRIVDARLDINGKHTSETNVGDFENPDLYHLAVRVAKED
jgi:hypothetical protein